eukprot:gene9326-biopygen13758
MSPEAIEGQRESASRRGAEPGAEPDQRMRASALRGQPYRTLPECCVAHGFVWAGCSLIAAPGTARSIPERAGRAGGSGGVGGVRGKAPFSLATLARRAMARVGAGGRAGARAGGGLWGAG